MAEQPESYRCRGGCHCGRVQIAVTVPGQITVNPCNCSICSKTGHVHLIVARDELEVLQGREELTEYRFNTRTARHFFAAIAASSHSMFPGHTLMVTAST